MYQMTIVSIRETLQNKGIFQGWLYLPDEPLNLNTYGIFIKEDIDADPNASFPPAILNPCKLTEALDAAGIEDIIENAEMQLGTPSLDELFRAFTFYLEHDAFLDFSN